MPKRIMFIGAGTLQSFAIKRAKEMGCFVIGLDRDRDAPGFHYCDISYPIDIVNVRECLACARKHDIDGVLSIAAEVGSVTAAMIAADMGLVGTHPEVYSRTRNKFVLVDTLRSMGVEACKTLIEIDQRTDLCSLSLECPVMVKPVDGSGSKGVSIASDRDELQTACTLAFENSAVGRALLQTFFEGHEYGAECFCCQGNVNVLCVIDKLMTTPPLFSELGHMCPVLPDEAPLSRIEDTVKQAIRGLGIEGGSVNLDLIVDRHGQIHIIDLSARMGGNLIGSHIVPLSTGVDLNRAAIQWALGEEPCLRRSRSNVVVTRILDMQPGRLKDILDYRSLTASRNVLDIVLRVQPGDLISPYRTNHDSCGYLVITADTKQAAAEYAEQVKARLQTCFVMEKGDLDTR